MEESLAGRSFHDAMDLDVYLHMSVDIGPQTCGHMSSKTLLHSYNIKLWRVWTLILLAVDRFKCASAYISRLINVLIFAVL